MDFVCGSVQMVVNGKDIEALLQAYLRVRPMTIHILMHQVEYFISSKFNVMLSSFVLTGAKYLCFNSRYTASYTVFIYEYNTRILILFILYMLFSVCNIVVTKLFSTCVTVNNIYCSLRLRVYSRIVEIS